MTLRRSAIVTLVTGAVLLAGCGDDGDAGEPDGAGSSGVAEEPDGAPGSIEDVPLVPLQEDADLAGLTDGPPPEALGDLLGDRPIVLNFFASWCVPCIEEMPEFESVHQDLGDDLLVLGMTFNDTDSRAQEIVQTTGVTYPTFSDPDGEALLFFEGLAMPTTVFLAPDGDVLDVRSRPFTESQLRSEIEDRYGIV